MEEVMRRIGESLVRGTVRGFKGGDLQYEDYQRRLKVVRERIFNPNVTDSAILYERESGESWPYKTIIAIVRYQNGNYSLRGESVDSSDAGNDESDTITFNGDEARKLYAFLDNQLHPLSYDTPSYSVLLDWARAVVAAYYAGRDDTMGSLMLEMGPTVFPDSDEDDSRDAEEEEPPIFSDDPREGWADETLGAMEFPPVNVPELGFSEKATITQEMSLTINGKKIKGKKRVLEIVENRGG